MLGLFATTSRLTPIHQVSPLYCRTPPAHRCPQRRQRQRVTEGTTMAPWNGPNYDRSPRGRICTKFGRLAGVVSERHQSCRELNTCALSLTRLMTVNGSGLPWSLVYLSLNSMGSTPTPTRTSSQTSARGSSRGSLRVRRLPRSACHEPRAGHARRSSPACPPTCHALFLARMSVRDARVYTCKRVLYTISYRVPVYKITR